MSAPVTSRVSERPGRRRMWLDRVYRSRHQLSLVYGIDGLRFETAYWYEDVDLWALEAAWGAAVMDRLCFHMLMLEASKLISLAPQEFDLGHHAPWYTPACERMWRTVIHKVWGQWRYRHDQPGYRGPRVLTDPVDSEPAPITVPGGEVATLVFCGGGKDSLVGAKLLERSRVPFATFGYSNSGYGQEAPQHALIDRLVQRCAGTGHHRLRIFDNCVAAPVTQAYPDIAEVLAAETPCSLFAALPVLMQHGYHTMVLAHERSANTGNLFTVAENQRWYFQMLGLGEHTPFECIGQLEEVRLAFELCRRKGLTGQAMDLYCRHFPELDTGPILARFLSVDMVHSGIPTALAARLGPLLEDGARQGRRYIAEILKCPYPRPTASA